MIIDGRFMAPHIGVWNITSRVLPEMGVMVLAMAFTEGESMPVITLMEWHILDDEDLHSDLTEEEEDNVFEVTSNVSPDEPLRAAWFLGSPPEDGEEVMVAAPHLWAEVRFVIPVPMSTCGDCGGIRLEEGDDSDEDCE